MELQTWITVAMGVITGASIALKTIAPLTENKVDDNVHEVLVKFLRLLSLDSDYNKVVKKVK